VRAGAALLLALILAQPARAETLVASVSTTRVAITSNYTGASIVVFGAIERDAQTVARAGPYDIVVTVQGPRQSVMVRQKEQLGPIWLNREQRRFAEVPMYLAVLTSRPIAEITTEPLRQRFKVGLEAIMAAPDFVADRRLPAPPFREALLRLQKQDRLYFENFRGVTFLTSSLFRATVPLPATAPPGFYEVDIGLFADGVLLARGQAGFDLVKTGFEQQVASVAREWSALYGLLVGAIALLFGWIASIIFRRD
jgi:uncharacterized protein (TIGR02186 family)